ncbi:MAG TPA: serine hydrolase [Gemmatimonadaceae bacterium]|nr:serine hydrolase [Gemmatimonadaceae bacterium]
MSLPSALNRDRAPSLPSNLDALRSRIESIAQKSNARAVAVALHDTETGVELRYEADRWFHGASTIKVAILLAVYGEIDSGRLVPQSRLHVRNRFLSAYDGSPFRVLADRDADSEVHAAIGKTMRVNELALHMIATSSNLATNLLLDLIGLDAVQRTLDRFGLTGLDVKRGVEDERAFQHGIINRVTADGLVALLGLIAEERAYSPQLSREMLDILHQQEFKKGIPARLPREVRVAHKTGDISTVAHDAGVVYAPGRKPYVIAILTEWTPDVGSRSSTIASLSHAVYEHLRGAPEHG